MSYVDIDEMYEKLLQIYKVRYGHRYLQITNPRAVLSYRISKLVREGRTREEAIKILYEEEGELTSGEEKVLEEIIAREEEEARNKRMRTPSQLGKTRCQRCDHWNPMFYSYCGKCGAALKPVSIVCPNCQESNPSSANFCHKCGEPLREDETRIY